MRSPKKRLKKVPTTKKGPKGIVAPLKSFFFLRRISTRPINAPVKNAVYKAGIILGNPRKSPRRKTSFTSPNPIPLPFVIKYNPRKNINAPVPEKKKFKNLKS